MSQEQGKIYIVEDDMTIVSLLKIIYQLAIMSLVSAIFVM